MIAGLICFNLLNTSKSSALASIADQPSPNTQKNMAWLQGMIATAIFITAPLGGWLAHQTWQGHRFMAAFPVALCLACLSLFLLQNTQYCSLNCAWQ